MFGSLSLGVGLQPMVKTHRRYQEIAGRISRYIAENNLHPGARLPGEIDLAKVCGVSRPTIREAMIALEIAGELEIRSGSGAKRSRTSNCLTKGSLSLR